eukprot:s1343_g11.t1
MYDAPSRGTLKDFDSSAMAPSPALVARNLSFVDENVQEKFIKGRIEFFPPSMGADAVTFYHVYFADVDGIAQWSQYSWTLDAPATATEKLHIDTWPMARSPGDDLDLELPSTAVSIVVVSGNAHGEGAKTSIALRDIVRSAPANATFSGDSDAWDGKSWRLFPQQKWRAFMGKCGKTIGNMDKYGKIHGNWKDELLGQIPPSFEDITFSFHIRLESYQRSLIIVSAYDNFEMEEGVIVEFEDLVDDSTFFLLGTRGRSLGEDLPVEPWLRTPEMGWDERQLLWTEAPLATRQTKSGHAQAQRIMSSLLLPLADGAAPTPSAELRKALRLALAEAKRLAAWGWGDKPHAEMGHSKVRDLKLLAQRSLGQGFLKLVTKEGHVLASPGDSLQAAGVQDGDHLTAVAQQVEVAACRGAFALWCHGGNGVVTWGDPCYGGDGSAVRDQLRNVQQIKATHHAFAAVLVDGSVVTWGNRNFGGDCSTVQDQLRNVLQIQATLRAFAAVLADGSVVTWGDPDSGGDCSAVQDRLKNVQKIQATDFAFAAILADGSVVAWGHPDRGGDYSAVQDQLRNVKLVQASHSAFAAILADGSVVAWGDPDCGGDCSASRDQLKNAKQIQVAYKAFAAILADGSVVTWGNRNFGGDSSAVQDQLRNVQQLQASTGGAFAGILADKSVVSWGHPIIGGDYSAVQDQLRNVQQIKATHHAFAAVLADGSVVTWGNRNFGGDCSTVQDQLRNVQQIQATLRAFAAVLADGSVVTWGDPDSGGDCSAVQDRLKNVQKIQATDFAFAAISADGSVVAWGHPDRGGDYSAVQDQLQHYVLHVSLEQTTLMQGERLRCGQAMARVTGKSSRLQQPDEQRSCLLVNFHVVPDAQKALHPKLTQDFLDARYFFYLDDRIEAKVIRLHQGSLKKLDASLKHHLESLAPGTGGAMISEPQQMAPKERHSTPGRGLAISKELPIHPGGRFHRRLPGRPDRPRRRAEVLEALGAKRGGAGRGGSGDSCGCERSIE